MFCFIHYNYVCGLKSKRCSGLNMTNDIENILNRYPSGQRDNLIAILQEIQDEQGFISPDSIQLVSNYLQMPVSKVFGIATFYDQFRFEPLGIFHFQICRGTACHILGSETVLQETEKLLRIKAGQTSRDGKFSLEITGCMGACNLSPVICVNGEYHEKLSSAKLRQLIDYYRKTEVG
jgi:NADH-quinone oxidoreductase subunit E